MAYVLYTLGYERRELAEFLKILVDADIDVLVDVRETAWSHKPGFSRAALAGGANQHGIEYFHASFVGNPKWLRDTAPAHADCLAWYQWYLGEFPDICVAFDQMMVGFATEGLKVCLTCFERYASDCHRGILTNRWLDTDPTGRAVVDLGEGELPRRTYSTEVMLARESLDTTFR
jgi:uncharacterized protein (DUF488 family)